MMEMDEKGVTWVGNICKKFENMCLEMEETLDATYLESQMRIVGESFTRFYSDVMKDLLPSSARDSDETTTAELPIDHYADVGFKQITVKANTKLASQDSSINHDFDNDAIYAESCDTELDIILNLNSDENQESKNTPTSMTAAEIFSTSESCEISNANQNHEDNNSKPSSAEVTTLASVTDCCSEIENTSVEQTSSVVFEDPSGTALASVTDCGNEIENASFEQTSIIVEFVKSDEENVMKMVSSSSVIFEDPSGFSIVRRMQPGDCSYITTDVSHPDCCNEIEIASVEQTCCVVEFVKSAEEEVAFEDPSGFSIVGRVQPADSSYNTAAASHPETCSLDIANITVLEQGDNKTLQQDDELKLEQSCVMVTKDELELVPKETISMMTRKKKRWQPFSLSKKSTRKQEYEELTIWHGNNEIGKGDYVESACPTLLEYQNKSLLPDLEWELL